MAFTGKVIRLNEKDYTRWKNAYQNIPNLNAYLMSRDEWLSREAKPDHRNRWFLSTAAYLAKVAARLAGENRRDEEGRPHAGQWGYLRRRLHGRAVLRTRPGGGGVRRPHLQSVNPTVVLF